MQGAVQQSLSIAHLSDVHYGMIKKAGARTKSAHYFVRGKKTVPDARRLASLLTKGTSLPTAPDVLVVSGDLGWSAARGDYKLAGTFLQLLRASWPNATFVIVPGNHDVDL